MADKTGVKFIADGINKYLKAFMKANKAIGQHNNAIKQMQDVHKKAAKAQRKFAEDLALSAKHLSPKELAQAISEYGKLASKTRSFEKILKDLRDTSKNVGLKKLVTKLKSVISTIVSAGRAVIGFGRTILNVLGKAFKIITAPIRAFLGSMRRIAEIAGGFLLGSAIRGLTNLLRDMQQAIVQSAADFEQLQIRMETMIARQARLSGQVSDVAESFRLAQIPAQNLLGWIQDLSLVAPIDPEVITNTLTLAMTMNQTTADAKDLTESILEFTTAMGFSSEVAERIIINLLQMERQGKITGRELTDLARGAMVPTNAILEDIAETMGLAGKEWESFIKDVKAGRVPVEDFLTSFKNVVRRDFPDAFERMGNTLKGAIQRLKNFAKAVIGMRVIAPVAKEIGRVIGGMVTALDTEETKDKLAALGIVIKQSFIVVRDSVKSVMTSLGNLAHAFGLPQDPARALAKIIINLAAFMKVSLDHINSFVIGLRINLQRGFNEASKEAGGWGENLIVSFASGMAKAISFILSVIAQIGRILSYWFGPGSPPRVAPDMDDWGASAMTEFLKGFLKADFSVFNEISGLVENFIRSLPTDIVAKTELIPSIIGSRQTIARIIGKVKEVGEVTKSMVDTVVNSIPNATNAFRKYVRVTLELADAQHELDTAKAEQEKIQSEINEINERYGDILDNLHQKLRRNMEVYNDQNKLKKINAALSSGLLTEEEKARLEAEKRDIQLREQIRNVEDQKDAELEAKEERLAAVSEEVKEAQARVDSLTAQKEAQEGLIKAQIEHNNLLKEHASILRSLAEGDGAGEGLIDTGAALADLSQIKDEFEKFDFEGMFAEAEENISGIFDRIGEQFSGLGEDIQGVRDAWGGIFGGEEAEGGIGQKIENVIGFISRVITYATILGKVLVGLGSIITVPLMGAIMGIITGLVSFGTAFADAWNMITGSFETMKTNLLKGIGELIVGILSLITSPIEFLKGFIWGFVQSVISFFKILWQRLVGGSIIPEMMQAIKNSIFGGLNLIKQKFVDIKDNVIETVGKMASKIKSKISSAFETAKTKAQTIAGNIREIWEGLKGKLVDNSIIPDMMSAITNEVVGGMTKSEDSMRNWARMAVDQTRLAANGVATSMATVQSQQQMVPGIAVAQGAPVTNNRTTNVTVNANYENQQSPADVNMDVQAALVASQI